MKFLDLLKAANKTKQHIHRVPAGSKRARQIVAQSTRDVIMPISGQGKIANVKHSGPESTTSKGTRTNSPGDIQTDTGRPSS